MQLKIKKKIFSKIFLVFFSNWFLIIKEEIVLQIKKFQQTLNWQISGSFSSQAKQ